MADLSPFLCLPKMIVTTKAVAMAVYARPKYLCESNKIGGPMFVQRMKSRPFYVNEWVWFVPLRIEFEAKSNTSSDKST